MKSQSQIINYTNSRLANWYKEVKESYNVIGSGSLTINNDEAKIVFTEDGVTKTFSMAFYDEYESFGIDYIFNIWMENARD